MITEKDLQEIEKRLKGTFATKEELVQVKSDLMTVLDKILKTAQDTNINITTLTHRVKQHQDKIEKLEHKFKFAS